MPLKHLNARLSLPVLGEHILPVLDGLYVVRVCGVRSNSMLRKCYLIQLISDWLNLNSAAFQLAPFTRVRSPSFFFSYRKACFQPCAQKKVG
jgi:hypothetical protein